MLQKKRKSKCITTMIHSIPIVISNHRSSNHSKTNDNNKKSSLRPGISYHCDHSMGSSISLHSIPLLCSMALLGLGMVMINPSIGGIGTGSSNGTAYAAPITEELNKYSSIAFTITKDDGTEIANNSTVSTEATTGLVNYITTKINLTTKKINRFYAGVQAVGGDGNLTGTINKATITPVAANTKPANFADNTWGYSLVDNTTASNELEYNPLPAYNASTPLQYASNTNLADGDYTLKLTFAAKINASSPADHYTTSALVSVLADAKQLTLMDIDEMQDMTSDICNATPAPTAEDIKNKTYDEIIANTPSKQLKDTRDNKYYWVSKLADGNCWMTQNLDFDVPAQLNTDGITSDVPTANFTTDTIKVNAPSNWPANNDNPNYNGYYDPGDYIYNGPSDPAHGQGTNCSANNSNADALKLCSQFSTTGDIHYHVGNYYSFSVATMKSGDNLSTSGDQPLNSICPKNWQLPTGDISGQFAELLTEYGVNSNVIGSNYTIYGAPLYFVYGGYLSSSMLNGIGNYGSYWSSTVRSGTSAFRMRFGSNVLPNNSDVRSNGFSVRCVAR